MSVSTPRIREDILRDPRYPVHRIADQLRPYLKILVKQFHPDQVILFSSYAYGEPTPDSDVDLLVVKPIDTSRVKDKVAIRRACWPMMRKSAPLSFDLLLATPEEFNGAVGARSIPCGNQEPWIESGMITNPDHPSDWFLLARDRLEKADAIFERFGASRTGIELLHEAGERYLKGYLIHHGW